MKLQQFNQPQINQPQINQSQTIEQMDWEALTEELSDVQLATVSGGCWFHCGICDNKLKSTSEEEQPSSN
ncbi:MAG: hypothetical protein PUP91_25175 [Rhizonema sp. PD37]|nr:hypothetical protein [Rhizonema sp. PD37]